MHASGNHLLCGDVFARLACGLVRRRGEGFIVGRAEGFGLVRSEGFAWAALVALGEVGVQAAHHQQTPLEAARVRQGAPGPRLGARGRKLVQELLDPGTGATRPHPSIQGIREGLRRAHTVTGQEGKPPLRLRRLQRLGKGLVLEEGIDEPVRIKRVEVRILRPPGLYGSHCGRRQRRRGTHDYG